MTVAPQPAPQPQVSKIIRTQPGTLPFVPGGQLLPGQTLSPIAGGIPGSEPTHPGPGGSLDSASSPPKPSEAPPSQDQGGRHAATVDRWLRLPFATVFWLAATLAMH